MSARRLDDAVQRFVGDVIGLDYTHLLLRGLHQHLGGPPLPHKVPNWAGISRKA